MRHAAVALAFLLVAEPAHADKTSENRPDFPPPRKSDIRDDLRSLFGLTPRPEPEPGGFHMKPSGGSLPTAYEPPPTDRPATSTRRGRPASDERCGRSMLGMDDLTELQRLLNFIWGSEAAGAGKPDGQCGPRTARSVEALQRAHGLEADGVPSLQVLALAREVVKGSAAEAPPPPSHGIGH